MSLLPGQSEPGKLGKRPHPSLGRGKDWNAPGVEAPSLLSLHLGATQEDDQLGVVAVDHLGCADDRIAENNRDDVERAFCRGDHVLVELGGRVPGQVQRVVDDEVARLR